MLNSSIKNNLAYKSLSRMFLMDDFNKNPVSLPIYEIGKSSKLTIYAKPSYVIRSARKELSIPFFRKKFNSLEDVLNFENSLFLDLVTKQTTTKISSEFLSDIFWDNLFKQIEQNDVIVSNVLISDKDENKDILKISKIKILGRDKKLISKNIKQIGKIWTADFYSTNLLPSGTVLVAASPDCLGAYFNRPLTFENDKLELIGAAAIVYPKNIIKVCRNSPISKKSKK